MKRGEWSEEGLQIAASDGQIHVVHPVLDLGGCNVAVTRKEPHQAYYDEKAGLFYLLSEQLLRVMACKHEVNAIKYVPFVTSFVVNRDDGTQFVVVADRRSKAAKDFQLHDLLKQTVESFSLSFPSQGARMHLLNKDMFIVSKATRICVYVRNAKVHLTRGLEAEIAYVDALQSNIFIALDSSGEIIILSEGLEVYKRLHWFTPQPLEDIRPLKLLGNKYFFMSKKFLYTVRIPDIDFNAEILSAGESLCVWPNEIGTLPNDGRAVVSTSMDNRLILRLLLDDDTVQVTSFLLNPLVKECTYCCLWNEVFLIVDGPPSLNSFNYLLMNGRSLCRLEAKGTPVSWMQLTLLTEEELTLELSRAARNKDMEAYVDLFVHLTNLIDYSCNSDNADRRDWTSMHDNISRFSDLVESVFKLFAEWRINPMFRDHTAEEVYNRLKNEFEVNPNRLTFFQEGPTQDGEERRLIFQRDMTRFFLANVGILTKRITDRLRSYSLMLVARSFPDHDSVIKEVKSFTQFSSRIYTPCVLTEKMPQSRARDLDRYETPYQLMSFNVPCNFVLQVLREWHPRTIRCKMSAVAALFEHFLQFFPSENFDRIVDKAEEIGESFVAEVKTLFLSTKNLLIVALARELLRRWDAISISANETFSLLMGAFIWNNKRTALPNERNWQGPLFSVWNDPHPSSCIMEFPISELLKFDSRSKEMMKIFYTLCIPHSSLRFKPGLVWKVVTLNSLLPHFNMWLNKWLEAKKPNEFPPLPLQRDGEIAFIATKIHQLYFKIESECAVEFQNEDDCQKMKFSQRAIIEMVREIWKHQYNCDENDLVLDPSGLRNALPNSVIPVESDQLTISQAMINSIDDCPKHLCLDNVNRLALAGLFSKSDRRKPFKIFSRILLAEAFDCVAPNSSAVDLVVKESEFHKMILEYLGVSTLQSFRSKTKIDDSDLPSWYSIRQKHLSATSAIKETMIAELLELTLLLITYNRGQTDPTVLLARAAAAWLSRNDSLDLGKLKFFYKNLGGDSTTNFSLRRDKEQSWNSWIKWKNSKTGYV